MLNKGNRESGYVLVSVLMIFLFLTLLSTVLMAKVLQSNKFVAVAENNIEEKVAAENIIKEATAWLEKEIQGLNDSSVHRSSVVQEIEDTLNELKTKYPVEVNDNMISNDLSGSGNAVMNVTITASEGDTKYTTEYTISTLAEVFKYASVTPGNLSLNGASYIKGDLYVGDEFHSSNKSNFIRSSDDYAAETSYPTIDGTLTIPNAFKYTKENTQHTLTNPITQEGIAPYFYKEVPQLVERELDDEPFDVEQLVTEAKSRFDNEFLDGDYDTEVLEIGGAIINQHIVKEGDTLYDTLQINSGSSVTVKGDLFVNNDLIMKSGSELTVHGDIYVNNYADPCIVLPLIGQVCGDADDSDDEGLISRTELSGDLTVNSTIFINGAFEMKNLNLDGVVYSNGEATISESITMAGNGSTVITNDKATVEDLDNSSGGTLVLMTEGELKVQNNNSFQDNPREMNAFFYTNSDLEIYGVWSNMKINGGLYGQNITLNAVKGKVKGVKKDEGGGTYNQSDYDRYAYDGLFDEGFLDTVDFLDLFKDVVYVEKNQDSIDYTKSRLQIDYNEQLMLSPPKGIPMVNNISLKKIDERFE
ncbi:hypothetical protein GCM10008986_26780 [Salinibacillus aidingensis]|uniref:PilX N-terminal n=1 Tax=Salinibacillus aidingensis TaxID=237684 RepID=A0ABN1BI16_9BACI